jgi:hypothetical protein
MTSRTWRVVVGALALVAAAGGTALVASVRVPLSAAQPTRAERPDDPAPAVVVEVPADARVAARSLFRISRTPAPRPYDPTGDQPEAAPAEPRPSLQLVGLVLGTPRAALLRGIPGHDAVQVLAEGDVLGELRLLTIHHAAVTLLWRGDTLRVALPLEGS